MATNNDVWAVVETDNNGQPKKLGLELTTLASELASQYGGSGGAIALGSRDTAGALAGYGAGSVFYNADPRLKADLTGPASALIAALIGQYSPRLVLFPSTAVGKDWAGRVAGKLGLSIESDVIEVTVADGKATTVNPAFNGALRVSSQLKSEGEKSGLLIVRPGAGTARATGAGPAEVREVPLPDNITPGMNLVESVAEKGGVPDLAGAQVIVSGGRGLGNAEKFSLVNELAGVLGGAVGATRAVVDMGWIPYAYQIGQTGKTVRPKLYIAVGISGEIQHKVGMQTSGTVVAINKDPNAPIFQFSDFGIIGDLNQVVPPLIEEIKRRKGSS